jgi:hypothetical protein
MAQKYYILQYKYLSMLLKKYNYQISYIKKSISRIKSSNLYIKYPQMMVLIHG